MDMDEDFKEMVFKIEPRFNEEGLEFEDRICILFESLSLPHRGEDHYISLLKYLNSLMNLNTTLWLEKLVKHNLLPFLSVYFVPVENHEIMTTISEIILNMVSITDINLMEAVMQIEPDIIDFLISWVDAKYQDNIVENSIIALTNISIEDQYIDEVLRK